MTAAEEFLQRARALPEGVDAQPGWGREKAHCDGLVAAMRRAELLSVCVPERFGGPGLAVGDVAGITFEIARHSGSAGLVYAMHMSQVHSIVAHGRGARFEALQERMVRDQLLIASGASEKGPGGDILTSLCETAPDGAGGFVLEKESPNISYVDLADLILVTANHAPEGERRRQVLIAAPVERDSFEPGRDTSFLGMTGILNRPYRFRVAFGAADVFADDFAVIARRSMTPSIQIFWAALWSGIAWRVLDTAKRFAAKEVAAESDVASVIGFELTRLVDRHHAMNAMIRDSVRSYAALGAATTWASACRRRSTA
jgi:acyl-CoA dehydrogenase